MNFLKTPTNRQKRKTTNQFHSAINRKSFSAFKEHEERRAMFSVPEKIHNHTKNTLHWYSGKSPIQKSTSSWCCSTHVSSHMSSGFSTQSVVFNWKNLTWEIITCFKCGPQSGDSSSPSKILLFSNLILQKLLAVVDSFPAVTPQVCKYCIRISGVGWVSFSQADSIWVSSDPSSAALCMQGLAQN